MKCSHCGGEMYTWQRFPSERALARELRCVDCGAQRLCSSLRIASDERGAARLARRLPDSAATATAKIALAATAGEAAYADADLDEALQVRPRRARGR